MANNVHWCLLNYESFPKEDNGQEVMYVLTNNLFNNLSVFLVGPYSITHSTTLATPQIATIKSQIKYNLFLLGGVNTFPT